MLQMNYIIISGGGKQEPTFLKVPRESQYQTANWEQLSSILPGPPLPGGWVPIGSLENILDVWQKSSHSSIKKFVGIPLGNKEKNRSWFREVKKLFLNGFFMNKEYG